MSVQISVLSQVQIFLAAPSQESLDAFAREQLLVADHISVVILGDKCVKENIETAVEAKCVGLGLLPGGDVPQVQSLSPPPATLPAVLKAYELVLEAYRQHFRSWERKSGQSMWSWYETCPHILSGG